MRNRSVYTVMADCGVGEFLWRKDNSERLGGVGGNQLSLMEENIGSEDMSDALFSDFCNWARRYMAALPDDVLEPMNLDWCDFNAAGVRLARRLQKEMAPRGHLVRYSRAWNDPNHDEEPFIEL
ncbi:hypothetical protein [Salinisphaera hydrothermalis]|uniref:Uncharacterized protein n=1 Tax=Salinisphaera hydrothermalis (strain C41B8) TaxID=1304275 RepID=A0A084ILM2_SALHC|nr:hypothetical protein [Salinisphaera hydrothermalis]KEZ77606.1 hypothetical protein C41B8_09516 [Salinisphaera hydrothermalis C41B8]